MSGLDDFVTIENVLEEFGGRRRFVSQPTGNGVVYCARSSETQRNTDLTIRTTVAMAIKQNCVFSFVFSLINLCVRARYTKLLESN